MSIDTYLEEKIKSTVKTEVAERFAPLRSLPEKFQSKITLTLEDMCEILGFTAEKIRDACGRGELPFRRIGRDLIFPRFMVEDYLLGVWLPEEKKNPREPRRMAERLVNL